MAAWARGASVASAVICSEISPRSGCAACTLTSVGAACSVLLQATGIIAARENNRAARNPIERDGCPRFAVAYLGRKRSVSNAFSQLLSFFILGRLMVTSLPSAAADWEKLIGS